MDTEHEEPRRGGAPGSRPVSRILSRAAIHLGGPSPTRSCRRPGTQRAASSSLLGVAPGGACRADPSPGRWCALTAPFHPYLRPPRGHIGGVLSVALSVGFPRLGVTQHPALWCPDFPHGARPRGCLACGGILPSSPVTPSIRAFLQVRAASSPQWLDGGARLAFLTGITGIPQAWAVPAAGGWPDQLTFGTERVGGLLASPDGRVLGVRARRRRRRAPPAAPGGARARAGRGRRDPSPRRLLDRRHAPGLHAHRPQRGRLRPGRRRPRDRRAARGRAAGRLEHRGGLDGGRHPRRPRVLERRSHAVRRRSGHRARRAPHAAQGRRPVRLPASLARRLRAVRDRPGLGVPPPGGAARRRGRVPDAGHRGRRGDRGARRAPRVDGQRGGLRPRDARRRRGRRPARRRPRRPRVLTGRGAARAAPLAAGRHHRRVGASRPTGCRAASRARPVAGSRRTRSTDRSSSASRASTASRCPTCATARATRRRSAGCTGARSRRSGRPSTPSSSTSSLAGSPSPPPTCAAPRATAAPTSTWTTSSGGWTPSPTWPPSRATSAPSEACRSASWAAPTAAT